MKAKDLINYTIPPLKLSDKIDKVQSWMSEFHTHELPIVEKSRFLGFFNESILLDNNDITASVGDCPKSGADLFVNQNEHYYEVLKKAYEFNSNMVAVIDDDENYKGTITIQDVVEAFSKMSAINSPGTIIVISLEMIHYSMTEISKIIESEGGKVLSSFVENVEEQPGSIRLTLKLNHENSSTIISALERFGYNISSIFGKGDEKQLEQERLDTLMHYLKV